MMHLNFILGLFIIILFGVIYFEHNLLKKTKSMQKQIKNNKHEKCDCILGLKQFNDASELEIRIQEKRLRIRIYDVEGDVEQEMSYPIKYCPICGELYE